MARRKAVRKAGSQVARKSDQTSKFPANRLPSELIHIVFAYLERKEAATFRWVGRIVAEIGLQYLTSKVCLRLREESFDRLLAIAEHPVASKCVVELEYETEGLCLVNREEFDQIFTCTDLKSQRYESSEQEASRNVPLPSKKRTARKTKQLLNRAWLLYEEYQAGHKKVEQADFFRGKMVEAFKSLPTLKIISTPASSAYERYVAEIKELLPTYSFVDVALYGDPLCVSATESVLLAAEAAGLQLSDFHCPRFNWQTLKQNVSDRSTLSRSIFHLKVLSIAFVELGYDTILKIRRLFSLITSAPNLERLGLNFEVWPSLYTAPMVNEIIKDFHWPSLKAISLDSLNSSEHYLVQFFERHKHTLREILLRDMGMPQGLWEVTFHEMRRTFRFGHQLNTCKLGGTFCDRHLTYAMESTDEGNIDTAGTMISNYIRATDVGDITLAHYWEVIEPKQLFRP